MELRDNFIFRRFRGSMRKTSSHSLNYGALPGWMGMSMCPQNNPCITESHPWRFKICSAGVRSTPAHYLHTPQDAGIDGQAKEVLEILYLLAVEEGDEDGTLIE